ncbi:hypothetical protein [Williamsia sp. CHRR-6]|uniref:hypothetical protein n=1 Tax=Williamsia sp. CHRR-6 TaxID=2835871 RepID=UPI001BD9FF43|nr:hypothetical protein [Williamsia sp. CHRR-6]MBT0566529.1 hypothetical protein [Williamsia sp. CHRR-6]
MAERFPDDCPTLTRNGQTVGFAPAPNGMAMLVWWRDTTDHTTDSEIIGVVTSYTDGVRAALRAIAGDGMDPDDEEVTVEATRLERDFVAIDWMGLGF